MGPRHELGRVARRGTSRSGRLRGGRRVAFVPPRFGASIVGGSEALSREIAMGLAGRGWDVEVLTSCASDHYTWINDLPEGVSCEDGVTLRRFPVVGHFTRVGRRAERAMQAGVVPPLDDQLSWLSSRFTVPELFHHLLRHGSEFDAVVFSPYLFWTATVCMPPVAERAVVMPCLHDETYARLDVVRPVLADPARVWFLAEPEHQLAHRLGPVADRHQVTGAGVTVPDHYDPEGFRARHGLTRPFVLFAGRREVDKGWNWLMDTFVAAVTERGLDLDLVAIGVGEAELPDSVAGRIKDLGFLGDAERDNAFAAAIAYVQPSRMESFSRTIMESWLAATPVLTIEASAVVAWHCHRSGGGLTFSGPGDLADALELLLLEPERGAEMAERGRQYVLREYSWPVVLDRMESDLVSLC